MKFKFNLDKPLEKLRGSGVSQPPKNRTKARQNSRLSSRLNLPLIGKKSVSLQLQVLATAFLVLLAFVAFLFVMDSRASTNRALQISIAGEMGVLTERIARLAPLAVSGSSTAQKELKGARERDARLLAALVGGGDLDGKAVLRMDDSLRSTLGAVSAKWVAFDKATLTLLISAAAKSVAVKPMVPADFGSLSASAASLDVFDDTYVQLRDSIEQLSREVNDSFNQRTRTRAMIAASGSLAMLMLVLFFRVFNDDASVRQALLAQQRRTAEEENANTQDAIRQLMDEMANLADGDLTARVNVSENFTGAIADAMNYAMEELSVLVKRINDASRRVATATGVAARTSEELLAASETQSQEISRASGQVLSMAQSMNETSGKAEQSAGVARQSLDAANKGATAVADSISGMDGIRGQIQETSKRIKRLGESSQEIGEIVELISDITEQTNVLALNAAIQAASAGEAGRGFTVVAEEVQRLAERSANATRRIASLVKTIQADTQGAISAMENSTQGVIEGARLSDGAGQALSNISTISRQLAELIEGISTDTHQQAEVATKVAQTMREILRVNEATSNGTRSTAISISELADLAVELKGSVAGFKV